jgi:hypothetical protein
MARPKGTKKTGGATRGSVRKQTLSVKDAVLQTFNSLNKDGKYLERLAADHPNLFAQLVAKMVPSAAEITTTTKVNLGSAMREAEARVVEAAQRLADMPDGKPGTWPGYDS